MSFIVFMLGSFLSAAVIIPRPWLPPALEEDAAPSSGRIVDWWLTDLEKVTKTRTKMLHVPLLLLASTGLALAQQNPNYFDQGMNQMRQGFNQAQTGLNQGITETGRFFDATFRSASDLFSTDYDVIFIFKVRQVTIFVKDLRRKVDQTSQFLQNAYTARRQDLVRKGQQTNLDRLQPYVQQVQQFSQRVS